MKKVFSQIASTAAIRSLLTIGLMLTLLVLFCPAGQAAETKQPSPAPAQKAENPLAAIAYMTGPKTIAPGQSGVLLCVLGVAQGYHINSLKPPLDWLVPTKISFDPPAEIEITQLALPQPKTKKFAWAKVEVPVYEKMVLIRLSVKISAKAEKGLRLVKGKLHFQACNDQECLAPAETEFVVPVNIGFPAVAGGQSASGGKTTAANPPPSGGNPQGLSGWLWMILSVFLGGLALNLTPCCYPLIPITIAYFGGQARSKGALAAHGLAYLIGLMVTYTSLGVIAALSGSMLGAALQHPAALITVAVVLLILSGSMFGFYELRPPRFLTRLGEKSSGHGGLVGSLVMGLTLGIVAAPCLGPFTLSIFTLVARNGDPLIGAVIFGALSFGLGLPLAVLGLVSTKIRDKLPTSGPWLEWVRRLLGGVIVFMALYLIRPLMTDDWWLPLMVLTAVGGALLALLAVRQTNFKVRLITALAWLIVAAWFGAGMFSAQPHQVNLYTPAKLAAAKGQPVILDFYASWCAPCRLLARTLEQPKIQTLLKKVVFLKVDVSDYNSKAAEAMRREHHISGVPTLIFLDRQGKELRDLRLIGALPAPAVVKRLEDYLKAVKAD